MRFDYVVIAFVVISLFTVGGTMMIQDQNVNYGLNTSTDDFGAVYNTMNTTYGLSQEFKNKTLDAQTSSGTSWDSLTQGGYSAVRLMTQTFSLFGGITQGIASTLGISCGTSGSSPVCIFVDAGFVIFVVSIIFGLIYMVFRFIPK